MAYPRFGFAPITVLGLGNSGAATRSSNLTRENKMIRQPFLMRYFIYHLPTVALSITFVTSLENELSGQVRREEVVPNPVGQIDTQVSPSDTSKQTPDAKSPSNSSSSKSPMDRDAVREVEVLRGAGGVTSRSWTW